MICCKAEGCFIPYLIDTQCTAFLGPTIGRGAGTRLHGWRNASLSSRRKLDKRGILLPLKQGALPVTLHTSPSHSFPASCELRESIFKEINPCATYLFSLLLPHPSASRKAWREFHYWCIFPDLLLISSLWFKINCQAVSDRGWLGWVSEL